MPTDDAREEDEATSHEPSLFLQRDLLKTRTVLVFGEITTDLAHVTCAHLLALAARSGEPIRVIVHSPGGHIEAADTIYDMIRFIEPEVLMIGTGWVASAGALIYCAAQKRNRVALPNTRFLLHQPLGGARGTASDVEIEVNQILGIRDRINRIFATATGQTVERITTDTQRNHWLTAEAARSYGLVNRLVERNSDIGPHER